MRNKRRKKRIQAQMWKPAARLQKCRPPKKLRCPTDFQQLRKRCLSSIRDFYSEGKVYNTPDGVYIYRDNDASILAVAHLDVVQPEPRHFGCQKGKSDIIYNCQLDDRLGAWIILDVLETLGVKVDILLTEGEEYCRSTAAYFEPEKEYNWLIEFDREGTDVVLYDYETPEIVDLLYNFGNKIRQGSYSDISVLDHLEVVGFNWGIGYQNGHFRNSYFVVSDYKEALGRFMDFYHAHKNTKFPHVPLYEVSHHIVDSFCDEERYLREEDREWLRKMESRQKLDNDDALAQREWDEEYWQLWHEEQERKRWEEETWGYKSENWGDCATDDNYSLKKVF